MPARAANQLSAISFSVLRECNAAARQRSRGDVVIVGLPSRLLVLAATLALAGCISTSTKENENEFPGNYRNQIAEFLQASKESPIRYRQAFLSDPTLTQSGNTQRYMACVRYSGRPLDGQFGPPEDHLAIFYAGHLNQLTRATGDQCRNAAYKPYPELEKVCRGVGCSS
jgi:hypothetical protein